MAGQEQQRHTRRDDGEPEEAPPPVPTAPATQAKDDDIDAVLDDIDEALEANAETFVRGFVQKGGE
ncbi:MAG TPA: ubiquitin-like protein Pup [Actinomycetales bacterium]|nr:ubiquitin-like protein Pup [Actinomycetales bacterium]